MNDAGKFLIFAGLSLIVLGLFLRSGLGRGWLGRLPGDLNLVRPNFSLHFPIVTCLLLSLLASALLWLFRR